VEHATGNLAAVSEQVLSDLDGFTLLDVRRAGAFQAAKEVISGATWQDPEKIEDWSHTLPRTKPIIVYCVFGHEVGQSTAAILHAKGIDAKFLVGGIHDWTARGRPTQPK
jgi:Fe-Mn family superoxide dismutase